MLRRATTYPRYTVKTGTGQDLLDRPYYHCGFARGPSWNKRLLRSVLIRNQSKSTYYLPTTYPQPGYLPATDKLPVDPSPAPTYLGTRWRPRGTAASTLSLRDHSRSDFGATGVGYEAAFGSSSSSCSCSLQPCVEPSRLEAPPTTPTFYKAIPNIAVAVLLDSPSSELPGNGRSSLLHTTARLLLTQTNWRLFS